MPIKKKIFLITALFYVFYLVFPLFADIIRIPVWLPSLATVAVIVGLYPKAFANRTFYWFVAYALVLGVYVLIGKHLTIGIGTVADNRKIIIEFAFILPTLSIFNVLFFLFDTELTRKFVLWFLIVLFASFIVAYPLMLQYNSLRAAYFGQGREFSVPGLPSYSLMHSYIFVLPLLFYAFKVVRKGLKWLIGIAIIASCIVIIRTDVGANIIIMVLIGMASMGYKGHVSVGYWLIGISVLLILYILYQNLVFVDLIDRLLPFFEDTSFEKKLLDFKLSMINEQESGVVAKRQNLHNISWNSFFMNPIFGTSRIGGHSSLIDRLGGMGLVAFVPFIMIFVSFIRQMKSQYQTKMARYFFYLGVIAGLVLLYQKGLWGCECWLMFMVLMPMGILTFENLVLSKQQTD